MIKVGDLVKHGWEKELVGIVVDFITYEHSEWGDDNGTDRFALVLWQNGRIEEEIYQLLVEVEED